MFERGLLDERSLIMFYLVLERLKGAQSALYPWLQALPQKWVMALVHAP